MNSFFLNLYLEKFNSFTNLFNPNSDLDRYAKMINKLQGLSVLTSAEQKAALSFIILFDSHEELNINNVDTEFNKTLYNSCIKTREHCLDLKSLSIALVDMAAFCSQNITWDIMNDDEISNKDDVSTFAHFNLYTGDEESWIRM